MVSTRTPCALLPLLLLAGCGSDCEGAFEILGTCYQEIDLSVGVAVALDVDADGNEELVGWHTVYGSSFLHIGDLADDGSVTILDALTMQPGGGVAMGDVDGDGVREIVNGHWSHVETFRVGPDGSLTLIASDELEYGPFGLVEDGDGVARLIWAYPALQSHTFVDGHWMADPTPPSPLPNCGVWASGIQGDFDGNGTGDVAFVGIPCEGQSEPNSISIFRWKDGMILESASQTAADPGDTLRGEAGDLDGDGIDDLLLRNPENRISISWGDTDTPLSASEAVELPVEATVIGLGDFDGDDVDEVVYMVVSDEGMDPVLHRLRDPRDGASGQMLVALPYAGVVESGSIGPMFDIDGDGIDDFVTSTLAGFFLYASVPASVTP